MEDYTECTTSDSFEVQRGVRQDCILSPPLLMCTQKILGMSKMISLMPHLTPSTLPEIQSQNLDMQKTQFSFQTDPMC